jgi:hypothetical protein
MSLIMKESPICEQLVMSKVLFHVTCLKDINGIYVFHQIASQYSNYVIIFYTSCQVLLM